MDKPSGPGSGADRTILESYLEMGKNYRRNKHKLLEKYCLYLLILLNPDGSLFIHFNIYSAQLPCFKHTCQCKSRLTHVYINNMHILAYIHRMGLLAIPKYSFLLQKAYHMLNYSPREKTIQRVLILTFTNYVTFWNLIDLSVLQFPHLWW